MLDWVNPDNFQNVALLGIAVLGILVFIADASLKRRETRRQFEEDREFRRERFEHEKSIGNELERQSERQAAKFDSMVARVATKLKDDLVEDTSWLSKALGKSEFHVYQNTLFGDRSEHFKEEKDLIARNFVIPLVNYIKSLLDRNDRVIIVIDSGSTLYPIFGCLAELAVAQRGVDPRPPWIEKLEIVTNNIPGALSLMSADRIVRADGIVGLPLDCTLVSGKPLTEYGAITGPDANRSLGNILQDRKENAERCHVISLVTGNWVRIRKSEPICPIPLARGAGHLSFKQAAMHHADETFVIAPLGKVFVNTELDEINALLHLEANHEDLKKRAYEEVDTKKDGFEIDESRIRLVSTLRNSKKQLLLPHSAVLTEIHGVSSGANLHSRNILNTRQGDPLFVPFDHDTIDENDQKMLDFPHSSTRTKDFLKLFHVNED